MCDPLPPMPPQWCCSTHKSANVSSMCLRAKRPPPVFPRWPPKSGDREDDGRPDQPQGASDPETADGGIRMRRPRRRLSLAQPSEATQLRRSAALSAVSRRAHAERRSISRLALCVAPDQECERSTSEDLEANIAAGSFPEAAKPRALCARMTFPPYSLPTGCGWVGRAERGERGGEMLGPVWNSSLWRFVFAT